MEFLLISDIHADEYNKFAKIDPKTGMNTRLEWILDSFHQLREYGEKNNVRTLLIGGDVFDKRGVISVPVYDAVWQEISFLVDCGWDIISIVGNHDQALRSGEIHALSPMPIKVIDKFGSVVVNKEGNNEGYRIGCVSFCETPRDFLIRLENLVSVWKELDAYLIHQGINGAKIAGDEILSRDEVSIEAIRDIVGDDAWIFSGHYHIHQKVDKRCIYIGSAVPKDFGDNTPKGFLHFKNGEYTQIESRAPKFVVMDENEINSEDASKKAQGNYLQIQYTGVEPVGIEKLKPAGWIATKKKVEREYNKRSTINPEHSPMQIIRSYVADLKKSGAINNIVGDGFVTEDLFDVLKEIVEGRTLEAAFGGHKIELDSLQIKNFMSCRDERLEFYKLSGLILIEGDNQDDPSAVSNGAGKSLISEAVKWVVFGTTARGLSGDDVVNNKVGSNCCVELTFKIDETLTKITRYRKHKEFKNQILFQQLGTEDVWIDLRGKSDGETQDKIVKYLGVNERTADNTVFFGNSFTKNFASLSDKEQKQILETILGVEYFNELLDKARGLSKKTGEEHALAQTRVSYIKTRLEDDKSRLERMLLESEKFEENKKKRIAAEKEDLEKYEKLQKSTVKSDSKKKELDELSVKLVEIEEEILDYKEVKEKSTQLMDQLLLARKKASSAQFEFNSKESETCLIEKQINRFSVELEELEEAIREKLCPTCGQGVNSQDLFLDKKESLLNSLKRARDALKTDSVTLLRLRGELSNSRRIEKNLEESVEEFSELLEILDDKRESKRTIENKCIEIEKELLDIERSYAVINSKIASKKNSIKSISEEKNLLLNSISEMQEEVHRSVLEIEKITKVSGELLYRFQILKFWENAFSDKGTPTQSPIKSYLFDAIVPVLDELSRIYSEILTSGSIEVQFNTVTELKSGEMRDRFSVDVVNKFGCSSYLGDSGGERRKVDLVIMFALHSLARIRVGSQIDVLFLDEILDSLDCEGCSRVMDLLYEMQSEIKKIFVITHNENLRSRFANRILVTKHSGESKIEEI